MPKLAVITRTKNRSLLLRRCAESLAKQTYKDFVWCVVNDAGEESAVLEILEYASTQLKLNTQFVNLKQSLGIANAANQGVLATQSEYVHLHDDDDTVDSDFYATLIGDLQENPNFVGAISSSKKIIEEIIGDKIFLKNISPLHNGLMGIHISDIVQKNQFINNALVYRRISFENIGGYSSDLPVLEDWDFNIRLLMEGDLFFSRNVYANYHIRLGQSSMTAQTITANDGRHDLYSAVLRNKYIRHFKNSGEVLALLVGGGRQVVKVESDVRSIYEYQKNEWTLKRGLRRVIKLIFG